MDAHSNVLVVDLNLRPEAEEALNKNSGSAKFSFVKADVTKWDQLQNAFDTALQKFGQLDIVVPGAGVFEPVGTRA